MGIGEPLDNYDNVVKFLRLANSEIGLNIGNRHFSLSTCGVVPQILRLAKEEIPLTLAISLHATRDEDRSAVMPINRKYSIDKLIEACKIYTKETGRRITFEYAMIQGVNDSLKQAEDLAGLLKGMLCHVNLIPVNPVEGTGFNKTDKSRIDAFAKILNKYGIEATVRRELGSDINAACGQLRRSIVESEKIDH
jgi:23S rRNA (adenine2503-C2)-methyltransferase